MRGGRPGLALEPLRTLFGAGTAAGLTDAQLLERFAGRRDDDAESAFAALVVRHGPMVRRACRSLLADPNDAEDVFQATFLVLARKAGTIRRPELLGNWLYGTAHRTARALRTRAARRSKHEASEAAMARARASTDPDGLEHQAWRHEEGRPALGGRPGTGLGESPEWPRRPRLRAGAWRSSPGTMPMSPGSAPTARL